MCTEVIYNIKNKIIAGSFQQSNENKCRLGKPWGKTVQQNKGEVGAREGETHF